MSSLFADTHNVVAILEKSDAAEADVTRPKLVICPPIPQDSFPLALTKKVFANMRWVEKGFSGVETPIFEGMLAARQLAKEGLAEEQIQADDAVGVAVQENVAEDGADFPIHIQQVLDVCSALTRRVENLEHDNTAQRLEIIKLQTRVKRLERANKVKSSKLRRLRKVGASRQVKSSDDMKDVFNQGRMIDDLDEDERIKLAEIYHLDLDHSSKVLNMQEDDSKVQEVVEVVTTAKLITDVVTAASQVSAASATISAAKPSIPAAALTIVAAYTRRRKGVITRDPEEELSSKTPVETPKLKDKGKGMSYAEICPIFQARFDENMRFLFKSREEMEEEDQEFYISFTTLLKNFNREDLENLWGIVKKRFSTSKPTNFSDEYLLLTLKTMFEKPNEQDAVWKSQRSVHGLALVKSWKLLTSCGVHIITLSTVQLILLVERQYPLLGFTLEQLVNVTRLQVEEESEMSLELLRFTRQQLQEYQQG
nr:hypothetical protein [Tanacetum cinerariifolium]